MFIGVTVIKMTLPQTITIKFLSGVFVPGSITLVQLINNNILKVIATDLAI